MPGSVHNGWPSWEDCGRMFPDNCVWTRFRIGLKLCLDSGVVSPFRPRRVKVVCVFKCNLPPALLAQWLGSFTCNYGDSGVERTPNMCQHTNLTLEKKVLLPLLPGFELATFRSRVRYSNQPASPATHLMQTFTSSRFSADGVGGGGCFRGRLSAHCRGMMVEIPFD